MSKTTVVEKWVDEAAAMTRPSKVTWADGSKPEYEGLVEEMLRDGTLLELNQKTYPGCYLHRSHPQDVARTEQLTFICSREADDAGPTNNWMAPAEAKAKAAGYFKNSMKDRRMWVIPYLMGPAGSAASRTGVIVIRYSSAHMAITRCACPTSSSRARGRMRSARGWPTRRRFAL